MEDSVLTLWEIVFAGISLRYLKSVTDSTPIESTSQYELGVIGHCRNLLEFMDRFQLRESHERVGRRLMNVVDELQRRVNETENANVGDLRSRLQLIARDLQPRLESEGRERNVFCVMPEREIQVRDLLEDPVRWFGISFGEGLEPPPDVLDDFQEAARAFAVGFPAPAIVFALRATEGMLRTYYEYIVGQSPSRQATWGSLTRRLRETAICPERLLGRLESLRDLRNNAMHTGSRLLEEWNHEAAARVILTCREIILEMSSHVQRQVAST